MSRRGRLRFRRRKEQRWHDEGRAWRIPEEGGGVTTQDGDLLEVPANDENLRPAPTSQPQVAAAPAAPAQRARRLPAAPATPDRTIAVATPPRRTRQTVADNDRVEAERRRIEAELARSRTAPSTAAGLALTEQELATIRKEADESVTMGDVAVIAKKLVDRLVGNVAAVTEPMLPAALR